MTRIQRIKQSIVDHRHQILIVGLVGSFVALTVAAEITVEKQEKENQEKLQKFIIEQNREGKTVVQLANGSYLGVTI